MVFRKHVHGVLALASRRGGMVIGVLLLHPRGGASPGPSMQDDFILHGVGGSRPPRKTSCINQLKDGLLGMTLQGQGRIPFRYTLGLRDAP